MASRHVELIEASRLGLWEGATMHWWQNWGHALAHPADNVVAAMLVVLGVAITAATTLIVSAANRRHELGKEIRERRSTAKREALDRIFQDRAAVYVEARIDLRDRLVNVLAGKPQAKHDTSDEFKIYTARLSIYGEQEVGIAFTRARAEIKALSEVDRSNSAEWKIARERTTKVVNEFDFAARTSIQANSDD